MNNVTFITALVLVSGMAAGANADVMMSTQEVSNTLSGYRTWDILATVDNDWTQAQMIIDLSQGNFYNHNDGGNTTPNPTLIGYVPELAFDTFVTAPGSYPNTASGDTPSIAGEAANLGSSSSGAQFTDTLVDVAWFDTINDGAGQFVVARVTVSDSASGTMQIGGYQLGDSTMTSFPSTIENGVVTVTPEPTTMGLIGLGAMALLRRRRSA